MKINIYIVTAMMCLLLAVGPLTAAGQADEIVANAEDHISPGGVILGGLTELGMLAFGIAWEGVRIVLPEGCPLKERDIDDLVGAHRAPCEESDVR